MKRSYRLFIVTTVTLLGAGSLSFAQQTEKLVRLKTADGKYVAAGGGGKVALGASSKESPTQLFTIIDANGGELADGDEVKIRYTAAAKDGGEPSKPSFWQSEGGELKRDRKGGTFKIKKVEDKYAFQTADGKFVGTSAGGKDLANVDSQDAALKVEIIAASAAAPAAGTQEPAKE